MTNYFKSISIETWLKLFSAYPEKYFKTVFTKIGNIAKKSLTRLHSIIRGEYNTGPYINADIILQALEAGQFDFSIYKINNPLKLISTFAIPDGILSKSPILEDLSKITIETSIMKMNGIVADPYFAGHIAAFAYDHLIKNGDTFSFETVMSDARKLHMFRAAKKAGYRIYLYFICTEDPKISIGRIARSESAEV